jgi:hypothetical protein
MSKESIQTLNYSAHAIDDLKKLANTLISHAPESYHAIYKVINILEESVKFILPNCCELLDPNEIKQAHLDLVKLPFPCVAFETPWDTGKECEQLEGFPQTPATKRIALCWELGSKYEPVEGLNTIINKFPSGGVFVLPIFWGQDTKGWTIPLGGTFMPYDNTFRDVDPKDELPASRIVNNSIIGAGMKTSGKRINAEPFYILPELYNETLHHYQGDREKVFAQIMLDSRDDSQVMIQACNVLNCENVKTDDLKEPVKLNKKRQKSGKQPFFSYKILQLSDEKNANQNKSFGGNHSSPRSHLRRGHLRRLTHKTVWVRASMINIGTSKGVVKKDYSLKVKS